LCYTKLSAYSFNNLTRPAALKIVENHLENINRILTGCFNREHKYQKMLYEKYYGFALKVVFRYIYRYDIAVDVANDGFIKFFTKIEQFKAGNEADAEKMLMGYLKRIMINTAIDELRKGKMAPEIGGIPDTVWDIPDNSENAEQMILYKELIVLIKELAPQYRAVFNLYIIDGYNHLEIADLLNIPVGTSKSCLSRARTLLQNNIKKTEDALLCRI
jgi:RNA polymerase sigma-70 factor (ECF subfamily)